MHRLPGFHPPPPAARRLARRRHATVRRRLRRAAAFVALAVPPLGVALAPRPTVAQQYAPAWRPREATAAPVLSHATVRVATGVRLHYVAQGDAAGPAVILLHGYSDTWYSYSRVLPLLSARHRVYALDLRGHGDSERPASGYGMDDLAADVLAFMDARGIAQATVVGHSMGSFVAQQVALLAPARVSRLVLVGSTTTPRAIAGMHEFQQTIDSLPDPVPLEFTRAFQRSTVHANVPDAFLERVSQDSRKLPAHAWGALMRGMLEVDAPVALGGYRIPTLVMWGDRDAMFPRQEQDALVALLGTATLRVYAETGHAPHWERPKAFARDLEAFLARPASR